MINKISALLCATLLSSLSPAIAMAADDRPDFATEKLTGDWGGLRSNLYDKGYNFDLYYKLDLWRNLTGGVQTGNRVLDDLDMKLTVDGGKAFGSDGTTLFFYLLNNNGGKANSLVGSNGGIDNVETSTHAFKLFEAWAEQKMWHDKVSVLVGLHDFNTEFYVTDTSGLFLNPTYGIGTEMAATGDNGPSVFPTSGLAARVAFMPTADTYVKAAVFDGVPGSVSTPRGTHVMFKDKEGALFVTEAGYQNDDNGHFGIGAWKYTAKRADLASGNPTHSEGMYFLADRSVYHADQKDVSAFARFGLTAGDVEQFKNNWSLGMVMSGFVPSRSDAQIGFAVTSNTNSSKYKSVNAPVDSRETQYELTYSDHLTPWLKIQPDIQYTVNPGTDVTLKNAWTAGLRFGVDF